MEFRIDENQDGDLLESGGTFEGNNPLYRKQDEWTPPSEDELYQIVLRNGGRHTTIWRQAGFNSPAHWRNYLVARPALRDKLNFRKNHELAHDLAEQFHGIGLQALIAQAKAGDFRAAKKLLDDQAAVFGWGSAEKETAAATGTGKSIAELFGSPEGETAPNAGDETQKTEET